MKPEYKNWMPKGMVLSAVIATAVCFPTCCAFCGVDLHAFCKVKNG